MLMYMSSCPQEWTLFCPNEAYDAETGKGLMDVWGDEFEQMYTRLEAEKKGRKTVKAQQLWFRVLESQTETGTPYMLYKDHANRKSNQMNLGTIIAPICALDGQIGSLEGDIPSCMRTSSSCASSVPRR